MCVRWLEHKSGCTHVDNLQFNRSSSSWLSRCDIRISPRCLMVMTSDFYNHVIWNLEVVSSILTGGFLCSSPRSILVSHADDKSVDISLSEGTACE